MATRILQNITYRHAKKCDDTLKRTHHAALRDGSHYTLFSVWDKFLPRRIFHVNVNQTHLGTCAVCV